LSLCQQIRAAGDDTPVLMLTARDTLSNKLEGFTAGTDDYMIKPFEIEELIVRLQALAKRRSGQASVLRVGPIQLNLNSRQVSVDQKPVKLSPTGFKLLQALMHASPNPVSQTDLIRKVWGDELPDSNKLRVHIHNVRKALDAAGAGQRLQTAAGFGFFLSATLQDQGQS